jgi:hypothetical protein
LSRCYRIVLTLLAVLATGLVLAAVALGSAFSQVYNSYRKHGHIAPCTFSEAVLNQAKAQVPPDIDQYAPDFPAALDAALQARAQGACAKTGSGATAAPVAPTATPPSPPAASAATAAAAPSAATTPVPTNSATAAPAALAVAGHASGGGGGTPAAIIALAVLAGLLAVAAGIWGLARWRGWDPPWVRYVSHAFSEAGVRTEATWAEFSDWVRLGR